MTASNGTQGPIRVLVVEDNFDDQALLRRRLKKTFIGNNVLFLSDPRQALDWLQGVDGESIRRELIAIFLDVHLPHMSGIELLRIIRSIDGMADFPVMVMTSSPHPDTLTACHELKVKAFVEKPVTFDDFSKVIAALFHSPLVPA
jgi:CheY-like chemotaxis protein